MFLQDSHYILERVFLHPVDFGYDEYFLLLDNDVTWVDTICTFVKDRKSTNG